MICPVCGCRHGYTINEFEYDAFESCEERREIEEGIL